MLHLPKKLKCGIKLKVLVPITASCASVMLLCKHLLPFLPCPSTYITLFPDKHIHTLVSIKMETLYKITWALHSRKSVMLN